jgi:hypothetical protein
MGSKYIATKDKDIDIDKVNDKQELHTQNQIQNQYTEEIPTSSKCWCCGY